MRDYFEINKENRYKNALIEQNRKLCYLFKAMSVNIHRKNTSPLFHIYSPRKSRDFEVVMVDVSIDFFRKNDIIIINKSNWRLR